MTILRLRTTLAYISFLVRRNLTLNLDTTEPSRLQLGVKRLNTSRSLSRQVRNSNEPPNYRTLKRYSVCRF